MIKLKSQLHFMSFRKRSWLFALFYFTSLWHILRLPKPDLIYASSSPLMVGLVAYCIYKFKKIPYFFETVDLWPDVPLQLLKYRKQFLWLNICFVRKILIGIENLIYKNAKGIITLSEGMTDAIIQKGIAKNKIHTIHNGTNTDYFKLCNDKPKGKIALGLNPKDVIILYSGTIGIANGCDAILYAANYLQQCMIAHAKFIFLGNGNDRLRIKILCESLALKNVLFIDSVPKLEVLRYFDAADIGLVSFAPVEILNTNSANKFFDYLAASIPICTNYEGWQQDYLQKYHCGWSAHKLDNLQFAKNILLLVNNLEMRIEMGNNGRNLAVECFNRRMLAEKLYNIFLDNDS